MDHEGPGRGSWSTGDPQGLSDTQEPKCRPIQMSPRYRRGGLGADKEEARGAGQGQHGAMARAQRATLVPSAEPSSDLWFPGAAAGRLRGRPWWKRASQDKADSWLPHPSAARVHEWSTVPKRCSQLEGLGRDPGPWAGRCTPGEWGRFCSPSLSPRHLSPFLSQRIAL